jgi:hypothetical protein
VEKLKKRTNTNHAYLPTMMYVKLGLATHTWNVRDGGLSRNQKEWAGAQLAVRFEPLGMVLDEGPISEDRKVRGSLPRKP